MKYFKHLSIVATCAVMINCGSSSGTDLIKDARINDGSVIASVNGEDLHSGILDTLTALNPRLKDQINNPLTRRKVIDSVIEQHLLYQEAVNRGLDKKEDIELKLLFMKHNLVSNAVVEDELQKSLQKTYDERKDSQFTKVKIGIIASLYDPSKPRDKAVKPTEAQKSSALAKINTVKARLNKGDDFAKVAMELSDDKMSKSKGGDSGFISKDDKRFARMGLEKLTQIAFNLKKDQTSDVIEAPQGYYIVKALSDAEVTPLSEAERILRFELQNTIKTKLLDDLKGKAKITYPTGGAKPEAKESVPASTAPVNPQSVKK